MLHFEELVKFAMSAEGVRSKTIGGRAFWYATDEPFKGELVHDGAPLNAAIAEGQIVEIIRKTIPSLPN